MMERHSIIPDSGVAAHDPGSRNEKPGAMTPWAPAFAGELRETT